MWDYGYANRRITLDLAHARECAFCNSPLFTVPSERFERETRVMLAQIRLCASCGWWVVYRVHQNEVARTAGLAEGYSATVGCLVEFDVSDLSVPLGELNRYLLAKRDALYSVPPSRMEEVVASVFGGLGWRSRVTGRSGDRGIDVVLENDANEVVGVQVKRYAKHRRIEAEQIRAFTGALMLSGQTRGVFVSTCPFRKGAKQVAEESTAKGYRVDLMDTERLLAALGVAQRQSFSVTAERLASYVMQRGVHIGTGRHAEFVPGEDLTERSVVVQALSHDDLVGLASK